MIGATMWTIQVRPRAGWLHCFSSHSNSNMLTHPAREQACIENAALLLLGIAPVEPQSETAKDIYKFYRHLLRDPHNMDYSPIRWT